MPARLGDGDLGLVSMVKGDQTVDVGGGRPGVIERRVTRPPRRGGLAAAQSLENSVAPIPAMAARPPRVSRLRYHRSPPAPTPSPSRFGPGPGPRLRLRAVLPRPPAPVPGSSTMTAR